MMRDDPEIARISCVKTDGEIHVWSIMVHYNSRSEEISPYPSFIPLKFPTSGAIWWILHLTFIVKKLH